MAPFGHGGPPDLAARVDAELRERIEEAVEFVCLDALVQGHRAGGRPAPVAESARDREEFRRSVVAFLERLRVTLAESVTDEQRRKLGAALADSGGDADRLLTVQVALAKELPDYWQRFDAVRAAYPRAGDSGGEGWSLLGRLFGR